jgi:hypothetical protein
MASGGVVDRPTLTLIGESGPEAVVPLNRASRGGFGGTQHIINNITLQIGNISNEVDLDKVPEGEWRYSGVLQEARLLSYVIGGVTLPCSPDKISRRGSIRRSDFDVDGDSSIVIVPGKPPVTLTLTGMIYVVGSSKSTLETTYLFPLDAMRGTEVTVSFPDNRYNGAWVVTDFTYDEVTEDLAPNMFSYTIQLTQGSDFLAL